MVERTELSVLFYSDASEFGGHEVMTLRGIQALTSHKALRVSVIFCEKNVRLSERLELAKIEAGNLTLFPLDFCSKSLQALRTMCLPGRVRKIQDLMKRAKPNVVVISQGRIEIGSAGLLAAHRAGIRTVSYIPMAHPVSQVGKAVAVQLRESINRHFYSLPDKFITISEGTRRMLLARGVGSQISVVPNCIERLVIQASAREEFRGRHGLKAEDYVVGIVGRIIFKQKAQDLVVRSAARFRKQLGHFKFMFIGDGRDKEKLMKLIAKNDLEGTALIVPWSSAPAEVYAGIDMLLIPSNFEGVPLVMLEAMACGLRIVAANIDGMAEFLPSRWLFPQGDCEELISALIRTRDDTHALQLIEANRKRVADECDLSKFGLRFADAVLAP